jgi:hypothetical protein
MMWSKPEIEQVRALLTQFNGAAEVCAVMGCEPRDLDVLSLDAFGVDFEEARAKYAGIGRAMLRKELMAQALDGNPKALDMLAREQLGIGPVELRARAAQDDGAKSDEEVQLAEIVGMFRRLPAAED